MYLYTVHNVLDPAFEKTPPKRTTNFDTGFVKTCVGHTICFKCRKPIHIECADFFYKFFSKVVEYDETHQCKNLDIYIVKSGNDKLEDVLNAIEAKKFIRKRTKDVCTKKRKRDIVNDIVPCRFCGEEIDLNESNHVLRCNAAPGTPLGRKIVPGSKNLAHKLFKMKRGAKFK